MMFPVTGFPCAQTLQSSLGVKALFRTGRLVIRDFRDSAHLRGAATAKVDDIFVTKAAWLSEILFRILARTKFNTALPDETRHATARFLAVKIQDCDTALVGLLWLSATNEAMAPLARCFAGSEKIPGLAYLEGSAAGQRLLRLLRDHSGSIDAQLEALILHMPGVLSAEERHLVRRIVQYDRSASSLPVTAGPAEILFPQPGPAGGAISRSVDSPWMRELVLLAKIVSVWLADLSRRHGRAIHRLDEIPEDEIARIAALGVNGIWLVGLWQRSAASARIKTLTGGKNYASAYSVFDYRVADEWGGDEALQRFRSLCDRYGIRLGCDMVPNHTGIDSKWIRENPDWYMQTEMSPFSGYSFNGENLSGISGTELRLEDHYYTKSDAAVVFAHDQGGRRRYIYHGNDGTGLPWNDTAQLDHTNPAVRQAIIDTALYLAQNFSIIRFDAAMTLTRDHYRRLWFPGVDQAPAIASRSIYGLSRAEYDARMPAEFWTELVTAFRQRQSDTLLIAEAFWMTEMYFVRNLGMHRVYNSAFMHSLRDEKNAEFETNLRNFRHEDADTLGRFVNYLSTPDEEAAAAHFSSDDKYFGAMVLMATLPGLPLIAPGQLEGYREKYGMDQDAPYLNEPVRDDLVRRYAAQIVPQMKKRAEFAAPERLGFPSCSKSPSCIVYVTGGSERYLVMFNNSARGARVIIDGADFCAYFPGAPEALEWSNTISGATLHAERQAILATGCAVELAAYETAVFSAFRPQQVATHTPEPAGRYPATDRHYSGVAIPISALRSERSCGIGEFADLRLMIDWCVLTGQSIINILPINDTGMNSSPYSALSAMALHPVYLRLDDLDLPVKTKERIAEMRQAHAKHARVAFHEIVAFKEKVLREIFDRDPDEAIASVPPEFRNQPWLMHYAVYRSLKDRFGNAAWFQWSVDHDSPEDLRELLARPEKNRVEEYFAQHIKVTGFYVWQQYLLHRQLSLIKDYADSRGIYLKGDMPIMLERDSVDVWLNPQLFNHHLRAGAPPDMFSPDGQNWGFPVYNWAEHEKENFSWWRQRIERMSHYFAAYRIDHVLGFFRLWCIEETNHSGRDGFFQPSGALSDLEVLPLLTRGGNLSALSRVAVHSGEVRRLPRGKAALLIAESGEHYLPDELTNEQGIRSLGAEVSFTQQLMQRLHSRPLLKIGKMYYPAWDFSLKLREINLLHEDEKHALAAKVQLQQESEKPLQQEQGQRILSALKAASAMLPCAEDLGVVPDYVRPTLSQLGILSLKVYRWEAENNISKDPQGYPFLALATSSVHDSSNLREWLRTEPASVTSMDIQGGEATGAQVAEFLRRLYASPAMVVMTPLQDLLALVDKFHGDAAAERINIPGTVSDFNWTYRMPLLLEDLLREEGLNQAIRDLVAARPA